MSLAEDRYHEKYSDRLIAPESLKTRRAREKLLKQLEEEKQQITPKALAESVDKIHKWIADHAKDRVRIEGKPIGLFNKNQNAAALSGKLLKFVQQLSHDMEQIGKAIDHHS